jgi:hypothetical protein
MGGPGGRSPHGGGMGGVPFRPNPLTPFPAREGGKFGGPSLFAPRREAKRWQTLSLRRWENGGPVGEAPMTGGMGGVPCSRRLKSASLKKVGLRQVRA